MIWATAADCELHRARIFPIFVFPGGASDLWPSDLGIRFWHSGGVRLTKYVLVCLVFGDDGQFLEMDHDETGCQASPEGPILCINNCGFFGSVATMNMCSKCYKDTILKHEHAKLAASSIENIVHGSSSGSRRVPVIAGSVDIQVDPVEPKVIAAPEAQVQGLGEIGEVTVKQGPNRCSTCKKRVGLTGFNCRCGDLFCSVHRYSDKHNCPFDYRTVARDAIAKANPVVKAEKLDKI
ncbi:Zinc finger A20 and AN1 domain-containing stress-associated protein 8 [Dionaea muscipula]